MGIRDATEAAAMMRESIPATLALIPAEAAHA